MSIKLRAISLFTGAGGLDIGLERSGFSVISANEIEPVYCETLSINKARKIRISGSRRTYLMATEIIKADIRAIQASELTHKAGSVDLIFGGPPCQPFSSAGKMQSVKDDRGTLFQEFIRVVRYWKPTTFLFENVRGLVTARGNNGEPGAVIKEIIREYEGLGYSCRATLLNAADYGAYQRRVRCFIIGVRHGLAPVFPEPLFFRNSGKEKNLYLFAEKSKTPWRTLGDFLSLYSDNDPNNWTRPLKALGMELGRLPNGTGLKSRGVVERTRPGGHWGYKQGTFIADLSLPARTVTGSTSQDWIRLEDGTLRRLTLKEVSALQGFPSEWLFAGAKADQYKQVGNAVPTIFGEILGSLLREYLESYDPRAKAMTIPVPHDFDKYIEYTKREEERNGLSRQQKTKAVQDIQ